MNEEEFLQRVLNKIAKEFDYDVSSTLELMFIKREKELDQYKNNWEELKKWLKKVVEIYNNVDVKTLLIVLNKMKELEEE